MKELEKDQVFSKSILWELQSKAYQLHGPDAWAHQGVPFYLTSNPLIAEQFAQLIASYLEECPFLDCTQPIYLFDLGAGSGRLAYLMLKHLTLLRETFPLIYVMTDRVEENLDFWKEHVRLKPFFEKGILDCALYSNEQEDPLELACSGTVLKTTANPVILICTYYFDTIPQDLFRVKNGKLEEGRISISVPEDSGEEADPKWIETLQASYSFRPIEKLEAYNSHPKACAILAEYSQQMEGAVFLFPSGGLLSLGYFQKMAGNRLLLLAGDQGVCSKEQVLRGKEPKISRHTSFSIAVNYHAIKRYFELNGGLGFLPHAPDHRFALIAGIMGDGVYNKTCLSFYQEMDRLQPVEYWHLTGLNEAQGEMLTLKQLLVLIKLGNDDPLNLNCFFETIRKKIAEADEETLYLLKGVVRRCLSHFYPVASSEGDCVMNMGVLLFEAKDYEGAYQAFTFASSIKGMDPQLMHNLALCKAKL